MNAAAQLHQARHLCIAQYFRGGGKVGRADKAALLLGLTDSSSCETLLRAATLSEPSELELKYFLWKENASKAALAEIVSEKFPKSAQKCSEF